MNIRRAEEKDIDTLLILLSEVLDLHAEIRPDIFIPGKTKYTREQLKAMLKDDAWNADSINAAVVDAAKDSIGNKAAFKSLYKILIGKNMGPRLGPFLASMDKAFVLERLDQASQ